MQILPIYNSYIPQRPSCKGNRREVYDKSGKMLYKTTTYLFRDDLQWNNFIRLLKNKYQNVDKVNFIVHCCSNGPEAYSCAISLLEKFGHSAKKFLPILAKDINSENIASAQQHGAMGLTEGDLYRANYYIKNGVGNYFNFVQAKSNCYSIALKPNDELKKTVIFEQGDIFKDIKHLPSKNTVLMCRNFWPYLSLPAREDLAQKLADKFDATSLVVVGDFDCENGQVDALLKEHGFINTFVNNIYTKPANLW